jgi:hypothetical protein
MTWVIGMPGLLTRGVLVGDVRITVRQPRRPDREIEGVQKIHRVADNIAIGFAGNIETALRMVWDAARSVALGIPEGTMLTQPSRFLFHWSRRLRWVWQTRLTHHQREGGVDLLWMAALPTTHPAGIGATMGWIVRSPDFEPERITDRTARSIGSGTHIEEYAAELYAVEQEFPNLIQFEAGPWPQLGGAALPIAISISDVIERHMEPGISPHLVICSVQWGRVTFATNDRVGFGPEAPTRVMPPIATTWEDWQRFKQEHVLADLLALG